MEISIIIPAYNSERTIAKTIDSALSQKGIPGYEIIIVDDGSTDNTLEVLSSFQKIGILRQKNLGPGMARNVGAKSARGNFLCFIDSDVILREDTISILYNFMLKNPRYAAVFPSIDKAPEDTGYIQCADYYTSWYHFSRRFDGPPKSLVTHLLMVKKEVLQETGFFDTGVMSSEDDLLGISINQLGYEYHFLRDITVYHKGKCTFKSFALRSIRTGFSRDFVAKKRNEGIYRSPLLIFSLLVPPMILIRSFYITAIWLRCKEYKVIFYLPLIILHAALHELGIWLAKLHLRMDKRKLRQLFY